MSDVLSIQNVSSQGHGFMVSVRMCASHRRQGIIVQSGRRLADFEKQGLENVLRRNFFAWGTNI